METNLLDRMLNAYLTEHTPVTVTLQNKIRVSGKIKAFDSYVIVVEGQKREILYRHAISMLAPSALDDSKRVPVPNRPVASKSGIKSQKSIPHKLRPGHQSMSLSAGDDQSINNGMKEGLLKWMQEQKAAK